MGNEEGEQDRNPESVAWESAYDLLAAAGVDPDKAASMALYASMGDRDPVAWAQKYLRLRRAARGS